MSKAPACIASLFYLITFEVFVQPNSNCSDHVNIFHCSRRLGILEIARRRLLGNNNKGFVNMLDSKVSVLLENLLTCCLKLELEAVLQLLVLKLELLHVRKKLYVRSIVLLHS